MKAVGRAPLDGFKRGGIGDAGGGRENRAAAVAIGAAESKLTVSNAAEQNGVAAIRA
jgi:hypothetical protein